MVLLGAPASSPRTFRVGRVVAFRFRVSCFGGPASGFGFWEQELPKTFHVPISYVQILPTFLFRDSGQPSRTHVGTPLFLYESPTVGQERSSNGIFHEIRVRRPRASPPASSQSPHLGFWASGFWLRASCSGFRVSGFEFRGVTQGFRVSDFLFLVT